MKKVDHLIIIFMTRANLKFQLPQFSSDQVQIRFGVDFKFQLKKWMKRQVLMKRHHFFDFGEVPSQ